MNLQRTAVILALAASVSGQTIEFPCDNGNVVDENPIGDSCSCANQVWISDDCKEGFFCYQDTDQTGCHIVREII